jgi:hypothetical protein
VTPLLRLMLMIVLSLLAGMSLRGRLSSGEM